MTTHPDLTTAAAYMDEAMKAIALAKQALLGGAGGALFVSSGPDLAAAQASPGNPYGSTHTPECLAVINRSSSQCICGGKHGRFTAGSAAEVAEGVPGWDDPLPGEAASPDEQCPAEYKVGIGWWRCVLVASHDGGHRDGNGNPFILESAPRPEVHGVYVVDLGSPFAADLCPAQWGEPPETMLCSLASGHDGNHATAEGIEWGGRWETAEPHGGAR